MVMLAPRQWSAPMVPLHSDGTAEAVQIVDVHTLCEITASTVSVLTHFCAYYATILPRVQWGKPLALALTSTCPHQRSPATHYANLNPHNPQPQNNAAL